MNPKKDVKRILVVGTGGSPSTNFIRSLRKVRQPIYIVGADANEYHLQRSEADVNYLAPSCNEKDYFPFLNYIIKKHHLQFMHIQNDIEMGVVSENREKLNIQLFLPVKETVRLCLDKYETYNAWRNAGIKIPRTYLIKSPSDLKRIYRELSGKIWLRATAGAGGKGALVPKDITQARAWINFNEGWGHFTAAELLTPDSITWMSIWKEGKLIVAQGRKRLYWELARIAPAGITGITGAGVTVADKSVDKIAKEAIFSIDPKPNGIFSVDLTYDFSGVPNPTEINIGRFFTTHEFFTRLGLNMPEIL